MNEFRLLSSQIEYFVRFSEIDKGVTIDTKVAGQNESDFILSASFVQLDQVVPLVIIENDNTFEVFGTIYKIRKYMNSVESSWVTVTVQAGLSSLS